MGQAKRKIGHGGHSGKPHEGPHLDLEVGQLDATLAIVAIGSGIGGSSIGQGKSSG
jgi:hypothetical protein